MRNIYFRLLVAILACFAQLSAVQATEVNLQQAREKAKTFILQRISEGYNKSGHRSASQLQMQAVETGQPLVYAFNALSEMPRLFLPNIAAGVIPKDVSYPFLDILTPTSVGNNSVLLP